MTEQTTEPTADELAAWAKKHPVGKKKKPTGHGATAAALVESVTPPPVAQARPSPAADQVWSTKAKEGRRFIRIIEVEHDGTATNGGNDSVLSVVIDERGVRLRPPVLNGQALRTKLTAREMPSAFRYEESLTTTTTTLDMSTDSAPAQENTTMKKATAKKSSKPSTSQGEPIRSFNRGLQILYLKQGTFTGYTTRNGKKYAMLVRKAADGEITVLVADDAERLARVGHGRKAVPAKKAVVKKAAKKSKVTKKATKK